MTIQEIYDAYSIPPSLQEHMLRVSCVAKYILEHMNNSLDHDIIISACLLHDMGNIIKFNFDQMVDGTSVHNNVQYRKHIQQQYFSKYGYDTHYATKTIVREVSSNKKLLTLVDAIGFSKITTHLSSNNLPANICCYADMRVMPHGVVSITERMQDLIIRYPDKYGNTEPEQQAYFHILEQLEQQVLKECNIINHAITHEIIEPMISSLRNYIIS